MSGLGSSVMVAMDGLNEHLPASASIGTEHDWRTVWSLVRNG